MSINLNEKRYTSVDCEDIFEFIEKFTKFEQYVNSYMYQYKGYDNFIKTIYSDNDEIQLWSKMAVLHKKELELSYESILKDSEQWANIPEIKTKLKKIKPKINQLMDLETKYINQLTSYTLKEIKPIFKIVEKLTNFETYVNDLIKQYEGYDSFIEKTSLDKEKIELWGPTAVQNKNELKLYYESILNDIEPHINVAFIDKKSKIINPKVEKLMKLQKKYVDLYV